MEYTLPLAFSIFTFCFIELKFMNSQDGFGIRCGDCGGKLTEVRPGKYQCDGGYTREVLKEVVFRHHLALPEDEEAMKWFDEGLSNQEANDTLFRRICSELNLGQGKDWNKDDV